MPVCEQHAGFEKKLQEMCDDIRDIKTAVGGDLHGIGLVARVGVLEDVNKNVNRLAWALGVPILLAAIFGFWKLLCGLLGVRMP